MDAGKEKGLNEEDLLGMRFVDDYLFLGASDKDWSWIKEKLEELAISLKFTQEDPEDNMIQFLDLKLTKVNFHLCWRYSQRSAKPVLNFGSNHTKIIKRGIVESVLGAASKKSCEHEVKGALDGQVSRLRKARYPQTLIKQIAIKIAMKILHGKQEKEIESLKVVSIPYYHGIGHRLKKAARAFDLRVVFSFPHKLGRLPAQLNREEESCPTAVSKHEEFRECKRNVIYAMPLSCGKYYVGQTYRCVNERLVEHMKGMEEETQGTLSLKEHKKKCDCSLLPKKTTCASASRDRIQRELQEAHIINKHRDIVISSASINLLKPEMVILNEAPQKISRSLFGDQKSK
jgi:hypothetical protein